MRSLSNIASLRFDLRVFDPRVFDLKEVLKR